MELIELAQRVAEIMLAKNWMLTTAESCTGGWVAQTVTAIAGSSNWFERGFVTYSNQAKQEMLDVPATTLQTYGAVSEATALAMAIGALQHSQAQISIAVTGVAGPDGGTKEKPVGTVWFGFAGSAITPVAKCQHFQGDRRNVREQSVAFALTELLRFIQI